MNTTASEVIELEVRRRVALCLRDSYQEIAELREKLVATDFRASVAEWAVAGVMGCNVRFVIAPEELTDSARVARVTEHFARLAGAMMLERAELHFRQHSELWLLKARQSPESVVYRDPLATTIPPKESWPRPFKVKP